MIKFVKISAQGNDYIYLDMIKNTYPELDLHKLAVEISDRNHGIGSDGLVTIETSNIADVKMRIFNADGSEAKMCGSAVRAVAGYIIKNSNFVKDIIKVETLSGIKIGYLKDRNNLNVSVNMGKVKILDTTTQHGFYGQIVSVGNPHYVVYSENPKADCLKYGELLSNAFPDGINVEFVRIIDRNEVEIEIWERGSGRTLACGTGSCAVFWTAYQEGKVSSRLKVNVPGGIVFTEIDKKSGHVMLEGTVSIVASGDYYLG
jgi:diaminopimelate epimerase